MLLGGITGCIIAAKVAVVDLGPSILVVENGCDNYEAATVINSILWGGGGELFAQ